MYDTILYAAIICRSVCEAMVERKPCVGAFRSHGDVLHDVALHARGWEAKACVACVSLATPMLLQRTR